MVGSVPEGAGVWHTSWQEAAWRGAGFVNALHRIPGWFECEETLKFILFQPSFSPCFSGICHRILQPGNVSPALASNLFPGLAFFRFGMAGQSDSTNLSHHSWVSQGGGCWMMWINPFMPQISSASESRAQEPSITAKSLKSSTGNSPQTVHGKLKKQIAEVEAMLVSSVLSWDGTWGTRIGLHNKNMLRTASRTCEFSLLQENCKTWKVRAGWSGVWNLSAVQSWTQGTEQRARGQGGIKALTDTKCTLLTQKGFNWYLSLDHSYQMVSFPNSA